MVIQPDKKNISPQPCPKCNGGGGECGVCAGSGRVLTINGIAFAWKKKLSRLQIEVDELEERVQAQIGMMALCVAVGGVAALGYLAYITRDAGALWRHITAGSDLLALPVWAGVLGCSYFVYHVLRKTLSLPTVQTLLSGRGRKNDHFSLEANRREGEREPTRNLKERSRDLSKVFSPPALHIVEHAYLLAGRLGTKEASTIHLFASAVTDQRGALLCSRLAGGGEGG